jgi:hypothetical protein
MTGSYKPQFANRWDFDTLEGEDMDDFMEALEADELSDDAEDHEAALDHWRQAQDEDGDELECGLSRHQLRVASKVLFSGLAEVVQDILCKSRSRGERGDGHRNGAFVSASKVAALAVALQLPGFERGAKLARNIGVTRASVSIWSAEYGRRLGVTSEASARKQRDGILSMARQKAGMGPRVAPVIQTHNAEDREPEAVKAWLESLTDDEKAEARKALKGKVA